MNLLSRVWGCLRGGAEALVTTGPGENVFPFHDTRGLISSLLSCWSLRKDSMNYKVPPSSPHGQAIELNLRALLVKMS